MGAGRNELLTGFPGLHRPGFNPRPAWEPGATCLRVDPRTAAVEFQSSPGMGAGRNHQPMEVMIMAENVSILARHGSRAQPAGPRRGERCIKGFNPRPAWEPGATGKNMLISNTTTMFQSSPGMGAGRNASGASNPIKFLVVSILARHGSRAQLHRNGY